MYAALRKSRAMSIDTHPQHCCALTVVAAAVLRVQEGADSTALRSCDRRVSHEATVERTRVRCVRVSSTLARQKKSGAGGRACAASDSRKYRLLAQHARRSNCA